MYRKIKVKHILRGSIKESVIMKIENQKFYTRKKRKFKKQKQKQNETNKVESQGL